MARVTIVIEDVEGGGKPQARVAMNPPLDAIARAVRTSGQARSPANLLALGLADALGSMAALNLTKAEDGKIYVPGPAKPQPHAGLNGNRFLSAG